MDQLSWNLCKIFLIKELPASCCGNVLQTIELLLITPFTSAKLEGISSRLIYVKHTIEIVLVKSDSKLRIGEGVPEIDEFDPGVFISHW